MHAFFVYVYVSEIRFSFGEAPQTMLVTIDVRCILQRLSPEEQFDLNWNARKIRKFHPKIGLRSIALGNYRRQYGYVS